MHNILADPFDCYLFRCQKLNCSRRVSGYVEILRSSSYQKRWAQLLFMLWPILVDRIVQSGCINGCAPRASLLYGHGFHIRHTPLSLQTSFPPRQTTVCDAHGLGCCVKIASETGVSVVNKYAFAQSCTRHRESVRLVKWLNPFDSVHRKHARGNAFVRFYQHQML